MVYCLFYCWLFLHISYPNIPIFFILKYFLLFVELSGVYGWCYLPLSSLGNVKSGIMLILSVALSWFKAILKSLLNVVSFHLTIAPRVQLFKVPIQNQSHLTAHVLKLSWFLDSNVLPIFSLLAPNPERANAPWEKQSQNWIWSLVVIPGFCLLLNLDQRLFNRQ